MRTESVQEQHALDVVTFGEAMLLLVADTPGPLEDTGAFHKRTAGAETNVAIGLARLGLCVGWASRLGTDMMGRYLIKAMAREPGYRSKVAVSSTDQRVDSVGACVGVRGNRIKNIVDELAGERIDIVRWSDDMQVLIPNALQPAEVEEVILCSMLGRAIVLVREDQLSLAIGRRGQNVRLASKLCGWDIEIMTREELDEQIERAVTGFSAIEGVHENLAEKLVGEGFLSYDDLSVIEPDALMEMGELTMEQVDAIVAKAEAKAEEAEAAANEERRRQREQQRIDAATAAIEAQEAAQRAAQGELPGEAGGEGQPAAGEGDAVQPAAETVGQQLDGMSVGHEAAEGMPIGHEGAEGMAAGQEASESMAVGHEAAESKSATVSPAEGPEAGGET